MPGFQLVQGFTEARLRRGLDPSELADVRAFVLAGRETPNDLQKEQLLRLSALYGDYFTPAGKAEWKKLTGIDVDQAEQAWRAGARLYANVLEARIDIAAERTRIREEHALRPSPPRAGGALRVESRFLAADVAARKPAPPTPASLTHAEALGIDVPPALLLEGLSAPGGRLVSELRAALHDLERSAGDGDGVLAPRDAKGAPAPLKAVLEQVWKAKGERALRIDEEIAPALAAAVHAFVLGGPRQENRLREPSAELYRRAVEDAVDHLARALQDEVVRGGAPYTLLLERSGIRRPAHKGAVMRLLEQLVPPPTLDEIAGLYRAAVDEKILSRDFYAATRLSNRDLYQLQASFPDLLPRPDGTKDSTALPGRRVSQAVASSPRASDVEKLAAAWADEVVTGRKTVADFARDHHVRTNVLTRLRQSDPARFPEPPRATSPADASAAEAFAAALLREAAADPFAKVKELIGRINEDEQLVAAHGELTYARYYDVRKKNPQLFGRVDDAARWQVPVAEKIRAVMAEKPGLSRQQLLAELQRTWPAMTYSRLTHLKEADPTVPIPGSYNRRAAADIDALAARIQEILAADPSTTHRQIARVLSEERGEEISAPYVSSIVRDFRPHLFSGIDSVDTRRMLPRRHSLAAHALLQLAIRAAPPGAPVEHILAVTNRLLEQRGVGTLDDAYLPRLTALAEGKGLPGPSAVHARTAAAIVAEYAAAADEGAGEEEILAAVRRDWPTLWGRSLGRFRGMWRDDPDAYPELSPFVRRGRAGRAEIELRGLGQAPKEPRFLGGRDPSRQLAGAPADEQETLARFAELAAVPLRLPEIDAVIADLQGGTPLKQANVLWVSHLLADVVPMGFALKEAGAESSRTIVVGTPYGTNGAVKRSLEDIGFSVRQPRLDVADYQRTVAKAVDDAIALHEKNGEPIVVLDDGGLVSHVLHSDPKYAPYRKKFRIVEQTTGGVLIAEKHALESVVVNVARSRSKNVEGIFIGEVVAAKIVQALSRFGSGLQGKDVVLVGYGVIGPSIAQEMIERGGRVTILERSKERAAAAKAAGFDVILDDPRDPASQAKRRRALGRADLVVGATGRRTISLADMKLLKDGAAVASASSKRVELDMDALERAATSREPLPSGEILVTLPTARYTLDGRALHVIGDGWPVNFDGGVQSVPPEKIQLTDAAMLAALFQASRIGGTQKGLVDLDPETDERLLKRHRALAERQAPSEVYDPARWRETVLEVARLYDEIAGP